MPSDRTSRQQRGRIGGLRRAALTEDRQALTQAARDRRWQRYVDEVLGALPHLTDEAEIIRRAEMLRRADMTRMSLLASKARRLKAEAARLEAQIAEDTDSTENAAATAG